jgi:uncharacterized protein YfbU (UPF0304 family)
MDCKLKELKNIIDAYSKEIYELKEENEKLKEEINSIKKYRATQDHKFMEYFKFYVQDKKKYDNILQVVDTLLKKYNC